MAKRTKNAEAVRRNVDRMQARGLRQIKIWVHPDDRAALRAYAKKKLKAHEV